MRITAASGPLAVLLAALLLSSVAVAGSPTPPARAENGSTTIHLTLQPDGDARWRVTMRFVLEDENDTAGFARLAREFESGESPYLSVAPFRRAAAAAENATDRSMRIVRTTRNASVSGDVGRLVLAFTWTNFARIQGDLIVLGDVFATPSGGTWLPHLAANQVLEISFPDRYTPIDLEWPITNGTVRISGPESFDRGEPSVTLARIENPTDTPPNTPTETRTDATPGTVTDTPDRPSGAVLPLIGGLGIVVVVVAGYLLWRRDGELSPDSTDSSGDDPPAGAEPGGDPPPESAAVEASGEAAEPGPADGADELLSDEERVLRLLRANDGRMKQAAIVEETDWSNAKVSQLLSEMEEADAIDKLRIGRENLISLPEDTPDEFE